jgi:hypothetical protein
VAPSFAAKNTGDSALPESIAICDSLLRHSGRAEQSHFDDDLLCNLGERMGRSTVIRTAAKKPGPLYDHSTFGNGVCDVVFLGSNEKMLRPDAGRNVTLVARLLAGLKFSPDGKFEGDPVSKEVDSVLLEPPIPLCVPAAGPKPATRRRLFDTGPEECRIHTSMITPVTL